MALDDGLDAWRPDPRCYLHDACGLHGMGHAARVLVWAGVIGRCQRAKGQRVDIDVARQAAVLHDVRRLDDGRDPAHGRRCRSWIDSGACPRLHDWDPVRRALVGWCCEWHVPADAAAPSMPPELACLKDADALDRVRLGPGHLNVQLLRTESAATLVDAAAFLCHASQAHPDYRHDPWTAVARVARHMGLWSASCEPQPLPERLRHYRL